MHEESTVRKAKQMLTTIRRRIINENYKDLYEHVKIVNVIQSYFETSNLQFD